MSKRHVGTHPSTDSGLSLALEVALEIVQLFLAVIG